MTRPTAFTTPIGALALCSLLWLSSLAPALAATVTETFQLKLTGTERCRNDSKFVKPFNVKFKEGATLALTRDDTGVLTDMQATIDNSGNATIDAIALNGLAFPKNTSGLKEELALSGLDPGNPDRFMTLRGTATFDKSGKLTHVTGTYVYQILSESGGVPNIDCLGSGTFGTEKLPSDGALTVANAPASVGGTFVTGKTAVFPSRPTASVVWLEGNIGGPGQWEVVTITFDTASGQVISVQFELDGLNLWVCSVLLPPGFGCPGASVDRAAGTLTVVETELSGPISIPPITLNGTLKFKPF